MLYKNSPMQLGDITSLGFELLKRTFKSSVIVVLVFMFPAALLLSAGLSSLLNNIPLDPESTLDPEQTFSMLSGFIGYLGSIGTYLLLYLSAWIGVVSLAGNAMQHGYTSLGDAFRTIFSVTFFKVLGQFILIGLALSAVLFVPFIVITIGSASGTSILTVLGILLFIAAFVFMIYLVFRWYFGAVHIIVSGGGVAESLTKSSYLVKYYWWRTFGIILLLGIIVDFAVSIISTPVFFLFMWDLISAMFTSPESFESGAEITPMLLSLFGKLGYIIAFTSALQLLINPLFIVVMYFDLRIRKDDIEVQPSPENPYSPEPSFGS
jgi:hypothetical protein